MCLAFVTVDLGRPDRFMHLFQRFNFPMSMLTWDVLVLNGYLALNLHICGYLIYCAYNRRKPSKIFYIPFVAVAIGWAISIHTVTAFLYVGLGGRPFWNSAIIAPRFLASAFAAGPAFLILTMAVLDRFTTYHVQPKAIETLRKIVAVALLINMFLLGCEVFVEFYTDSAHGISAKYLFLGLGEKNGLVPWIWSAVALNTFALLVLVTPIARWGFALNTACAALIVGIWIDKGMGLIVPAFIPTPLGDVVEYLPTLNESLVCLGIWAFGLLLYTIFVRISIPVLSGRMTYDRDYDPNAPLAPTTPVSEGTSYEAT